MRMSYMEMRGLIELAFVIMAPLVTILVVGIIAWAGIKLYHRYQERVVHYLDLFIFLFALFIFVVCSGFLYLGWDAPFPWIRISWQAGGILLGVYYFSLWILFLCVFQELLYRAKIVDKRDRVLAKFCASLGILFFGWLTFEMHNRNFLLAFTDGGMVFGLVLWPLIFGSIVDLYQRLTETT